MTEGMDIDTKTKTMNLAQSVPEKHEKLTQSKFDIFFLHEPFSGFYKRKRGKK